MDPHVKIYSKVNHDGDSAEFRISRMEELYESRDGKTDDAHRHDFYTVLLVKRAVGKHIIDFNEYEFSSKQLHFVSPGQVHQVIEKEKSFGFALLFSDQFLINNHIPLNFIEDLNLFNSYGESPPIDVDDQKFTELSALCDEIWKWNDPSVKFGEHAIGSILKLFLIECNNLCSLPEIHEQNIEAGNTILKNFKTLVNLNHHRWHSTSEYASELHISSDHLNRTVKLLIGKGAKEYLQDRVMVEARRMLLFSELSAKEIGFALGFEEASNFSAFFSKHAGISPSAFRQKA